VLIDIADGRLSVADPACRIVVGEASPVGCWTISGLAARTSDFSEGRRCLAPCGSADAEHIAPSCNVAPTDPLPVAQNGTKAGERRLDVMRWGLVPFWAKDSKVRFANINAKAEGVEGKPALREAFRRRHCLVPVDNFYGGRLRLRCSPLRSRLPNRSARSTYPSVTGAEARQWFKIWMWC